MPRSTIPLTLTPKSSQIHAIGYEGGTLAIEFNSNHQKLTYHYPNFSAAMWAEFQAAESKGSYFKRVIKPMYPEGFERMVKESESAV